MQSDWLIQSLEPRRLLCAVHVEPGDEASMGYSTASAVTESRLSWTGVGRLPVAREEGAGASVGGKLYVMGGFINSNFDATPRVDIFDPAKSRWTRGRDMPLALTHTATIVTATRVWLFGGYVGADPGPATAAVLIYNVKTNKWTRGPDMPAPRGAAAAGLAGNTVYVFGGRNKARTTDVKDVYALNLDTNQWSTVARMPNPRNHLSGAVVDGQVYAIGGQKNEGERSINLTAVHRYNPKKNRWFAAPDLPEAQSHTLASTFVYDRKVITVGGESAHNVATANTFVFDPYKNEWSVEASLPKVRRAPQAALIGSQLFVAGGSVIGAQRDEVYATQNLDDVI